MSDRVVVFLDYQNVYRRARATFHDHEADPHWMGQIDPLKLGLLLAADSPYERELLEVRVYRGIASQKQNEKAYAAGRRQVATWEMDSRVHVVTRTLQYLGDPAGSSDVVAREKGIDVALAIDFATMACDKAYDVGIIFSLDTDLKPALEYVLGRHRAWGTPRAEVAAWSEPECQNRRLAVSGSNLFCHWVKRVQYTSVQDTRDYTVPDQ